MKAHCSHIYVALNFENVLELVLELLNIYTYVSNHNQFIIHPLIIMNICLLWNKYIMKIKHLFEVDV